MLSGLGVRCMLMKYIYLPTFLYLCVRNLEDWCLWAGFKGVDILDLDISGGL